MFSPLRFHLVTVSVDNTDKAAVRGEGGDELALVGAEAGTR